MNAIIHSEMASIISISQGDMSKSTATRVARSVGPSSCHQPQMIAGEFSCLNYTFKIYTEGKKGSEAIGQLALLL